MIVEQLAPEPSDHGITIPARFEPQRRLGQGGMGTVLAVRDHVLGREVALKVLSEEVRHERIMWARFIREARAAAILKHPNIVTVYDVDVDHGFIVMELVHGESLFQRIKREGALPLDEVLRIGQALLSALACAHDAGIIHRDVKPGNVLLEQNGHVKLTDFGVAFSQDSSLTNPGSYVGTPAYAAPEQLRGATVDARADIYSTGVTLFYAATGKKLHTKEGTLSDPERVLLEETADAGFVGVIMRAMSEQPEQRFPSARAFADALLDPGSLEPLLLPLETVISSQVTHPEPPPEEERPKPAPPKKYSRALFALLLLLPLLIAAAWIYRPATPSPAVEKTAAPVRIALLRFSRAPGMENLAFAGGGLAHLLGQELRRVPGVSVLGYYTLLGHLGNEDAPLSHWMTLAEQLQADLVAHGDLAREGDHVKLTIVVARPSGRALARIERHVEEKDLLNAVRSAAPQLAGITLGENIAIEPARTSELEADRHLLLGIAALEQHRLSEAVDHLRAALDVDPDSGEAHYYLALATWWHSLPSEVTLEHLEAALKTPLDPARETFLRGLNLLVKNQHRETIAWFGEALIKYPDDRDILYGQFEALYHAGYPAEAMALFRKLTAHHPSFRLGMIHALAYYVAHANEEGMNSLVDQRFVTEQSMYASWLPRMAIARRDYRRAEEMLGRMIDQAESAGEIRDGLQESMVELYAVSGRVELAIAALSRRAELSPDSFADALTMSALYSAQGAKSEALKWRTRADELCKKMSPGWPALDALINLTLLETGGTDQKRAEALYLRLENAPLLERKADPRYYAARVLLAAATERFDVLQELSNSEYPEVAGLAIGFLAIRSGYLDRARAAFSQAIAHSNDGRFAIVEYYHMAWASRLLGDHRGTIAACGEVIQPRMVTWSWAAAVGPCRSWTADAQAALAEVPR